MYVCMCVCVSLIVSHVDSSVTHRHTYDDDGVLLVMASHWLDETHIVFTERWRRCCYLKNVVCAWAAGADICSSVMIPHTATRHTHGQNDEAQPPTEAAQETIRILFGTINTHVCKCMQRAGREYSVDDVNQMVHIY